jgi:heat shock protein HtpX
MEPAPPGPTSAAPTPPALVSPIGRISARTDFHAAIRRNKINTLLMCFALILVGGALGYLLGWTIQAYVGAFPADVYPLFAFSEWGWWAAIGMLTASVLWTCFALVGGHKLVLHMTDAVEVAREKEPLLHNVVEEMAIAAGVKPPRVYVIESDALNAYATGMTPSNAAIVVTRGLLNTLSRDELQGVVGHEMGHIMNFDIRYATAVAVMVGLIVLVSDVAWRGLRFSGGGGGDGKRKGGGGLGPLAIILFAFAFLAPFIAKLVQMAVSRQREYLADASSVQFTRNPAGLIGALEKIDGSGTPMAGASRATQHLFIVNPLERIAESASELMSTHPATSQRISRLRNLG